MRPFALTMQSQRLDVQRLGLALLAGATLMGAAWGAFAAASRARPSDRPGECVDPGDLRRGEGGAEAHPPTLSAFAEDGLLSDISDLWPIDGMTDAFHTMGLCLAALSTIGAILTYLALAPTADTSGPVTPPTAGSEKGLQ